MKQFIKLLSLLFFALTNVIISAKQHEASFREAAHARLRSSGIQFIEFLFTTPLGETKSVLYALDDVESIEHLSHMYVDGSSLKGCSRIVESDLKMTPDWSTVRIKSVPSNARPNTAVVVCNLSRTSTSDYEHDPRSMLQRAMNFCQQELGYRFYVGTELEFYIVSKEDDCTIAPVDKGTYFDCSEHGYAFAALQALMLQLSQMDLPAEKLHHEVGPGQQEISFRYGDALRLADTVTLAKYVISQFSRHFGFYTTFMPKPFADKAGNGMHLHFSLFNEHNENVFYNAHYPEELSAVGRSFVAGVLAHAPAMTLLFNPTINSYKRLIPGFEAPIHVCCGKKNRSALIRIPLFEHTNAQAARAELRSPDSMCNIYLALAALLYAGIDGIKKGMDLDMFIEENLYDLTEQELAMAGIKTIPSTLDQAIEAFEKNDMLRCLLGDSYFETLIAEKKQELRLFQQSVTDWEIKRYFS